MQSRLVPYCLLLGVAITLPCGNAWADIFVIDGSTNPMTYQYYVPVGGGHYNYPGASQSFDVLSGFAGPDIEAGELDLGQGLVPENPSSSLGCDSSIAPPQ